ncbi:hypothetical protein F4775DRAFT_351020 [Biscogniauxia sp. FL1348]|nr:hypothetical protein F4775DRAFT_351020 [Biscogniauxia sp. FL1348]
MDVFNWVISIKCRQSFVNRTCLFIFIWGSGGCFSHLCKQTPNVPLRRIKMAGPSTYIPYIYIYIYIYI